MNAKRIQYSSRSVSVTNHMYGTTEKECHILLWSVLLVRPYLERTRFSVCTYLKSLKWIRGLTNDTGWLARWSQELSKFKLTALTKRNKAPSCKCSLPTPNVEWRHSTILKWSSLTYKSAARTTNASLKTSLTENLLVVEQLSGNNCKAASLKVRIPNTVFPIDALAPL